MRKFGRIAGVFLGGFCFAAALGASGEAHAWIQEKYAPHFCTPINASAAAAPLVFNSNGLFNNHDSDDLTVTCPVKMEHNRTIAFANVQGWDNDEDHRPNARWCFADETTTTTGCGPVSYGSNLGIQNYHLNVDTTVSNPFDYNFLSITIPGGPNLGSSSLRGYNVAVNDPT
jgi:hypothetical protein